MTTPITAHIPDADAATVRRTFDRLAPIYDMIYGTLLMPGRRLAMKRMAPDAADRVLEVGVGTGIGLELYPRRARVVGIDLSASMLRRAAARLQRTPGHAEVDLRQMDATKMEFEDHTFDVVYAPYVLNVVPDALAVALEMRRVCRPGGRIVLLNHFRSKRPLLARVDDAVSVFSSLTGTRWNLPLEPLAAGVPLYPLSSERVNVLGFSSLIVCRR
jgi:phosphatidylethanolamine/phosphatidyl-N-methylethanolamine N-methyltransferase